MTIRNIGVNDHKIAAAFITCFCFMNRDGATKSGLLRAISDVINRVTSDGEVDVFAAVKHVQNVRQQCVMSEVSASACVVVWVTKRRAWLP